MNLTDNEIIKALECCKAIGGTCESCAFGGSRVCIGNLHEKALDLINRQQVELEMFDKIATTVNGFWEGIQKLAIFKEKETTTPEELLEYIDNLKNEAIKEFAERLKEKKNTVCAGHGITSYAVDEYVIDCILKEMVSEV